MLTDARPPSLPPQAPAGAVASFTWRNYRWVVCALLFLATTVNYVDRQILSLLKEILDRQIGWTNEQFGWVNATFQLAYGVGLLGFGWFVDRFGTKLGYAVSIAAWSVAAMGHALVGSVGGFIVARAALGLGESGNFPSAVKAVALWFPKRERAFATSLFNAGTNAVKVCWPDPSTGWVLQQNNDLNTTNWVTNSLPVVVEGTNRCVTVSPPVGSLFFRLGKP